MREYQQFIGGEWGKSEELFDDLDPYRGTAMARVAAGTRADLTEVQWITTRDGTGHSPI